MKHDTDVLRLLSTASSLLTTLHNPLNLTLLTHQLLTAPALWERPEGLRTSLRVLSVFHSAVITVLKREDEALAAQSQNFRSSNPPIVDGIPKDEWLRAVIKGADERSARWTHVLVLGGLLLGFGPREDERLSNHLRQTLEKGFVQATNVALREVRDRNNDFGAHTIALTLNHVFPLLPDWERAQLDYDLLLPILVGSVFFSPDGLQSAYFLASIDLDLKQAPDGKLDWPLQSTSSHQMDRLLARPIVSSLGPFARLTAHAVENVRDSWLIPTMIEDLQNFSRTLFMQWRQSRLSMIDTSAENQALSKESVSTTAPKLWKLLRSTLFATIIILRGALGRVLSDRALASDVVAPVLVTRTLHTLRHLYFITVRLGTDSFTQYTFVNLTAIDILSKYPIQASTFLQDIRPSYLGTIPENPLDRTLDLYFLNTAEHFTLVLPPNLNEDLLVASASPYLAATLNGNTSLLPIFEAAHSVMLAVLSAPQSAELTAKHLPFYVDALFRVFPDNLSPRQFRIAFKTLLRVLAPPSILTAMQPDLPATLLELLHHRAMSASSNPLDMSRHSPSATTGVSETQQLSEQAALVLTLLDSLPYLPLDMLEEWLPLAAELVHIVPDQRMREACKTRFWEVLISGDMDAERSQIGVMWWATRGGREMVLFGPQEMTSGALNTTNEVVESKL